MKVPFFGNDRQYENLKDQWRETADEVWASGQYFQGPHVERLEKQLAKRCQRKYAIALSSCTDALKIASSFYDVKNILVTNFSFLASASAAKSTGPNVNFVDIDPQTFSPKELAYRNLASSLNLKDYAIIHVELFGASYNIHEVEKFCLENKIPLIEDAAQSFGAFCSGRPAGSFGDISCLSFDPTKVLSATGPAGALVTDSHDVYTFAKEMRLHGKNKNGEFTRLGMKSLMGSFEAALLGLKMEHLSEWIDKRNDLADIYFERLSSIKKIKLPLRKEESCGPSHTFHKMVIRAEDGSRDALRKFLSSKEVETRIHYARPMSMEPLFKIGSTQQQESLKATQEVLSLPLFQEMETEEVEYVCDKINYFFSKY